MADFEYYGGQTWVNEEQDGTIPEGAVALSAENLQLLDNAVKNALPRTGGEVEGDIVVKGKIVAETEAENDNDVITKGYIDKYLGTWYTEDEDGNSVPLKCLNHKSFGSLEVESRGTDDTNGGVKTDELELFTAINSGEVWLKYTIWKRRLSDESWICFYRNDSPAGDKIQLTEVTGSTSVTTTHKTKLSLKKGDKIKIKCEYKPTSTSDGGLKVYNFYLFANQDTPYWYSINEEKISNVEELK